MTDQQESSLEWHVQVWVETAGGQGPGSADGKTPGMVDSKADGKGAGKADRLTTAGRCWANMNGE